MDYYNRQILRLKRSQNPGALFLKRVIIALRTPTVPRWPRIFYPVLRFLYEGYFILLGFWRVSLNKLIYGPLFQSRCASFGKGVEIHGIPYVNGHAEIHMGDRTGLGGNVSIHSGRIFDQPRLVMMDGAVVGWNSTLVINKEIIIEQDVIVSYDCRISDSDGHPREMDLRALRFPPRAEDVRPVRIGRGAWIGNGVHIMKGVTIGEGAVISANSVVIMDVPAFCLAMGNPAEVYFRNYGLPSTHPSKQKKKKKKPTSESLPADVQNTTAPAPSAAEGVAVATENAGG
jgi:acetyltransferase-like isoleucine patch superfamily enzyme